MMKISVPLQAKVCTLFFPSDVGNVGLNTTQV
jgi:hypothetical protein